MLVKFSKAQQNIFVMPTITVLACEHIQKSELLKKIMQSKSGQSTYWILVNTHFGRSTYQTQKVLNRARTPISRPQMVYITPLWQHKQIDLWDGHHWL